MGLEKKQWSCRPSKRQHTSEVCVFFWVWTLLSLHFTAYFMTLPGLLSDVFGEDVFLEAQGQLVMTNLLVSL